MAKVPPHTFQWCCGRCATWNPIERGTCSSCGSMLQDVAKAFRLQNVLTDEERNYYEVTAPMILTELRWIRELLEGRKLIP
jgi:hypothetical protein